MRLMAYFYVPQALRIAAEEYLSFYLKAIIVVIIQ
jgi:hypothetical protein